MFTVVGRLGLVPTRAIFVTTIIIRMPNLAGVTAFFLPDPELRLGFQLIRRRLAIWLEQAGRRAVEQQAGTAGSSLRATRASFVMFCFSPFLHFSFPISHFSVPGFTSTRWTPSLGVMLVAHLKLNTNFPRLFSLPLTLLTTVTSALLCRPHLPSITSPL